MFSKIRGVRVCYSLKSMFRSPEIPTCGLLKNSTSTKGNHNLFVAGAVTPKYIIRFSSSESFVDRDPLLEHKSVYRLNDDQIASITGGDPDLEKKIRVLQVEFAVQYIQNPTKMPSKLNTADWKCLLGSSRSLRSKYLFVLWKKEMTRLAKKRKGGKEKDDDGEPDKPHLQHRLFRNGLFPMIQDGDAASTYNRHLAEAIQFSPPLIMDCGFENIMSVRDVKNCVQQVMHTISINRQATEPFNMMFCNLQTDSFFYDTLWAACPVLFEESTPIITTEVCYTKLFPKERLVYLTPHCRESIQYDRNDVYIIGTMVDKSNPAPHSLIKAKQQGLRMGKFPIDKYLYWKCGTKSLTLNQAVSILLGIKNKGDWNRALEAVPTRKIVPLKASGRF